MMAESAPSTSSKAVIASVLGDEDLSHEQIQELLQQAELRLRKKTESPSAASRSSQSLPKLNVGNISQSYITSSRGICRVDSSCLLEKDVRDLADHPRKATILSVEKKKLAEVRRYRHSRFLYHDPVLMYRSRSISLNYIFLVIFRAAKTDIMISRRRKPLLALIGLTSRAQI